MLVYLDTVICIYAVEGAPSFRARAKVRLAAVRTAGDQPTISDLTWLGAAIYSIALCGLSWAFFVYARGRVTFWI